MPYSQANRPIRINTELGPDVLLLDGFHGVEAISMPFGFRVDLLSETEDIDPLEVLRSQVAIVMALADGTERVIHGRVSRFSQAGQHNDLTAYSAEIVPWLWFLSLSRESRIYQNLSVLDIVEQVFNDHGFTDFEILCTNPYPVREYCVQYRETHLNFVQRLLEEEGIYYFFTHTEQKHVLVLADDNSRFDPCPGPERARFGPDPRPGENIVSSIESEHSAYVGTVTLRDYNYLKPSLTLESALSGEGKEEIYDYPGSYASVEDGDRYARVLLETEEASRQVVRGEGTCRGFQAGSTFELTDHYRSDINGEYILTRVQHFARMGSYRAWDEQQQMEYRNDFLTIPAGTPYRPPRRAAKPVVHGSQTALVTGPAGEEVWVDKHGRIKVQFYWDRVGGKNEKSSCWIRVVSPWAGKNWGSVSIPRIGNEVVVEFLEGDPDRPLVTGSVYNEEQRPPFELPSAGVQMGMKSRTSPGGGGYNEISLTDTSGKEVINVHAQKDRSASVGNSDSVSVGGDRSMTVSGKLSETVKKDMSLTVTDGNYSHSVAKGKADISVKKDLAVYCNAALTETAKAAYTITSKTAAITISASTKIKLIVGGSSIEMDSGGKITIKGKSITIDGSDDVTVLGKKITVSGGKEVKAGVGSQQMTCDPAKVNVSGASINSSAVGMHTIAGAVVKIN